LPGGPPARAPGGLSLIHAGGEPAGCLVLTICYSLEFHGRFVLLDDEFCRTQGLPAIRLEVAWQNPRALELYKRSGYWVDAAT